MKLVIDCSVTMAWCFEDETTKETEDILEALIQSNALVPSIWPLEVVNVLAVAERRKRISASDSVRFMELVSSLPIQVVQESSLRIFGTISNLARTYELSSYDAAYLDLAMREGAVIATQDKALRKAAKACKVKIF